MTLTVLNKTIYQGADDDLAFVITDATNTALDITNASFEWAAYHDVTGDVLQKTLGNGLAFGDPTKGQIAVVFATAEMTIPPLAYTYQLEMTVTANGTATTSIEATGYLIVQPNRLVIRRSERR